MPDPHSPTAYMICRSCAWVFPLMHTPDDMPCTECGDDLIVVDDHEVEPQHA